MINIIKKTVIYFAFFIGSNIMESPLFASEKIKDCDFGNFSIIKNKNVYQVIMKGNILEYFIRSGVFPFVSYNPNQDFRAYLFLNDGEFLFDLNNMTGKKILFHIYDYGHITIIAKDESGLELAAWNYRYCR